MKRRIADTFPYYDTNALDSARFLYGNDSDEVEFYEGDKTILDYLEEDDVADFDASLEQVPEGQRNSTMSHIAGKIIKRYGNTEDAYQIFIKKAELCNPPLPESELKVIWRSASKFGNKVSNQEGYIPPEQYNSDCRLKPNDFSDVGQATVLATEYKDILRYSPSAVSTITIPFTGYVGITQTACTCAVGTLPTGITVKTNTAATSSAAGKLELSVAASSNLGADATLTGNIMLTFTISGKPVTKVFTWTKSKAGSNGASAVVFSVYAPNGTIVQNQSGSILLATSAYAGSTAITSATYQWAKYSSGSWTNISGETSETLTVSGSDIINIQSYRCTMTYGGKNYVDVITVEDKSDPYVSEMLSIGGYTVKNNLGGVVPYVIVRTNQKEVDSLLGSISETAPSAPKSGDFWYKIDHTEKSVTLMKYNGTSWISASEKQSLTYTWYAQDKDGKEMTFNKAGKVIYLSAADIDSIMTLQCDVSS